MKTFLRYSIVPFFVFLLFVVVVFLHFNPEYRPKNDHEREDYLRDYKQACIKTGGNPVWNGRHLECLQESKT